MAYLFAWFSSWPLLFGKDRMEERLGLKLVGLSLLLGATV
jgi:hypothetical protein